MTHAQQRVASEPVRSDSPGGAPRGMWAVAWRQHRSAIAVLLGMMAVLAAGLVWFRARILSLFTEFGCELFPDDPSATDCADFDGLSVWWNYGLSNLSAVAHLAMLSGPVILGVFAAAPIFTREFSRGTQVLALTQSVSRTRWFAVKTTILAVPLTAGLAGLGYLMEWVDGAVGFTDSGALTGGNFFARNIMPAAVGLMAFALATGVGMFTRATVATLVISLLLGLALLVGVGWMQPYILPAERTVTPLSEIYAPITQAELDAQMSGAEPWPGTPALGKDDAWVNSGYLDSKGQVVSQRSGELRSCYTASSQATEQAFEAATTGPAAISPEEFYNSAASRNVDNAAMLDCMTAKGLDAQYADVLPGSLLWPLRWLMAGILVALAALFTGVGAWRLRWAVAKR